MADRSGKRVRITGGMSEFVGRTGVIKWKEGDLYRVALDAPVRVPNFGSVYDDLWESRYLKTIK